ncbi:Carboxylesterase, type B domain-containing protein [Strongyloides ratti]|uniref:Carboxylesterase, type B domain-containing protein n=1 Tax=Strongyloides ratti TaxID=34506 RepID=A0A090L134_STRRB|nr:Carboxylesterase, type B domain-containing protein [Strongyloides ratti]CEF63495.1 Carboxylesterase, type B domain-containing protein [Strongyloides ratti]
MGCTFGKNTCECTSEEYCEYHSPFVQTFYGNISGFKYKINEEHTTNVFLGIPFAKPPIGNLRFKKPEPPEKWDEVLEAYTYKSRSIQKNDLITDFLVRLPISEDCLYLNIVTPNLSDTCLKKFPVMVFIHGGSYYSNNASRYHYSKCSSYLVRYDVIFVTIQYRLGFLGYFYTGDESCETNLGLWDQYFALKWVHENIESFNGDSNNITVVGQSAGASSADLLSLSPYSKNLFNKCVLFGGNANALWAIADKDKLIFLCRQKANELGFEKAPTDKWSTEDNLKMMEFLKKIPGDMFVLSKSLCLEDESIYESCIEFGPIIDGDILPKTPHELRLEVEPKPSILGVCQYEGLLLVAMTKIDNPHTLFEKLIEGQKRIYKRGGLNVNDDDISKMLGYNKNEKNKMKCMENVVKILGFLGIELPTIEYLIYRHKNFIKFKKKFNKRLGKFQSNISNDEESMKTIFDDSNFSLYLFRFDHYNPNNFVGIKKFFPFIGATHCTELNYFIGVNHLIIPYFKNSEDIRVRDFFTRAITNFAKFGDPNEVSKGDKNNVFWSPVNFNQNVNNGGHLKFCFMKIKPELEMEETFGNEKLIILSKFYMKIRANKINIEKLIRNSYTNKDIEELLKDVNKNIAIKLNLNTNSYLENMIKKIREFPS